jgi:hypothetical protein
MRVIDRAPERFLRARPRLRQTEYLAENSPRAAATRTARGRVASQKLAISPTVVTPNFKHCAMPLCAALAAASSIDCPRGFIRLRILVIHSVKLAPPTDSPATQWLSSR